MPTDHPFPPASGLEAVFLANREALLRFLAARGAGESAEDLLHEVWLKLSQTGSPGGPIAAPLPYLYRVANNVMVDRYRSQRQAAARDTAWLDHQGDLAADRVATPERIAEGRDALQSVLQALEAAGPRAALAFRRHRIDGVPQRDLASELGVSLSTLESDLRTAYRLIAEYRERSDEV